MAIDVRDRKLLWGRAGNRCAFESCRERLIERVETTGKVAVVSQEAHIVAREPEGPRGKSPLTTEQRDSYPNLVLLCLKHHKIVDDDPDNWTVETLHQVKSDHESWVEQMLSPDELADRERTLQYATICDRWCRDIRLSEWADWTSGLLSPTPTTTESVIATLDQSRRWLFSRAWPETLPDVERSFENFRQVLGALWMVADHAMEKPYPDNDHMRFVPFQKRGTGWITNYDELAKRSDWVTDLIHDLVFELTRAANNVCDLIRLRIDGLFREDEGLVTVERQGAGLFFETWRPRYSSADLDRGAFVSLETFLDARSSRDVHFGSGVDPEALASVTPMRLE